MNDREFRAMLQASRQRNRYNSYAYTDTPTSHEVPKFTRAERKGIDEVIIGFCRSEGHPKYNRKLFYILKNLDEINAANVTNHLQRQATRLSHELPSDKYCALLAVMCAKLIGVVEHHMAVGNIEPMENEQPDFEFDPYILEEF